MKILVVDDSRAMRTFISKMVNAIGHETETAEHGQDALEKLQDDPGFSAALVDWNMPVMDGLELVKAIRASDDHKDMPIMMITTETEIERVMQALDQGADEYLMKPFTQDELGSKLEILLADRAA